MVRVRCENCGRMISVSDTKMRRLKHHFCSRECWIEWLNKNPEYIQDRVKRGRKPTKDTFNKLVMLGERMRNRKAKNLID